jgi:hypothetical protein
VDWRFHRDKSLYGTEEEEINYGSHNERERHEEKTKRSNAEVEFERAKANYVHIYCTVTENTASQLFCLLV